MRPESWNELTAINDVQHISIARGRASRDALTKLLLTPGTILAWLYTMDLEFMEKYVAPHLPLGQFYVITDYRSRHIAAALAARHSTFHARSWASNRTMHDKTWLTAVGSTVILTTANATTGSWTLSKNRCVIITSQELTMDLADEFWSTWNDCRPIIPSNQRYLTET